MMPRVIGVLPMWCVRGHHVSNSAVKMAKARSTSALTVTLLRTGLMLFTTLSTVPLLPAPRPPGRGWVLIWRFDPPLEGLERLRPEMVEVVAQRRERVRVQRVDAAGAVGTVADERCLLEDAQMLRHGRATDRQVVRQI